MRHSVFRLVNRAIGVLDRPQTPATLVMLGMFEVMTRRPEIFQGRAHLRLIGPRGNRRQTRCYHQQNQTCAYCFHHCFLPDAKMQRQADLLQDGILHKPRSSVAHVARHEWSDEVLSPSPVPLMRPRLRTLELLRNDAQFAFSRFDHLSTLAMKA